MTRHEKEMTKYEKHKIVILYLRLVLRTLINLYCDCGQ